MFTSGYEEKPQRQDDFLCRHLEIGHEILKVRAQTLCLRGKKNLLFLHSVFR